jgi:hypothetical protein
VQVHGDKSAAVRSRCSPCQEGLLLSRVRETARTDWKEEGERPEMASPRIAND